MTAGVFTAKSVCQMYVQWCKRVVERLRKREGEIESGSEGRDEQSGREKNGGKGREKQKEGEILKGRAGE